jgi:hypothetical protein
MFVDRDAKNRPFQGATAKLVYPSGTAATDAFTS